MRFQYLSRFAAAALLTVAFAFVAVAQTVTATGTVKLRQADGTEAPLQGATIVIHRTDLRGEYRVRTDRNGRYTHVGLPLTGIYTFIISGPNARPTFSTNIRLSQRPENDFVLEAGDGSTLTIEQVRAAAAATAGDPAAAGAAAAAADSAAVRQAAAEEARRQAEFEEERRRVEATNVRLNDVLRAGNDSFNAALTAARAGRNEEAINQFTQAITHFDQGIQADPEQGVFHLNKAAALRSRGVERYNIAVRARNTEGTAAARSDFTASIAAAERAIAAYRALAASRQAQGGTAGAAAPTASGQASAEMLSALEARAESYRLAMHTNTPNIDADAMVKAIEEYVAAETDAAKKARAQASLGDALFQSGRVEEAIAAHRRTLQANPNNVDAIYGLGLALAADATGAHSAEARSMFQQFLSKAPATDSRRETATQIIEGLNAAASSNQQQQQQRTPRRGRP